MKTTKRTVLATLALLTFASVWAAEPPKADAAKSVQTAKKKCRVVTGAEADRLYLTHQLGGALRDTRAQKGRLVIVNAQQAADVSVLRSTGDEMAAAVRIAVAVEPGAFDLAKPTPRGEVTVFVTDDPKLPMSLVAPEAKWAMVNVAPLKSDKKSFFASRVRKMLTRAMAFLLGAPDSQYPMCLLGCVTRPEDLDRFPSCQLPFDVQQRLEKHPAALGISPYRMSDYLTACQEGWAHSPTNKYQKRIWDKVHALPTAPIKIVPEKKK